MHAKSILLLWLLAGLAAFAAASPATSSPSSAISSSKSTPTKTTATTHYITSLSLLTLPSHPTTRTSEADTTTTLTSLSLLTLNTTIPSMSRYVLPSTTITYTQRPPKPSTISLPPHEIPPLTPGVDPLSQMKAWSRQHASTAHGGTATGSLATGWSMRSKGRYPECRDLKGSTGYVGYCTKGHHH